MAIWFGKKANVGKNMAISHAANKKKKGNRYAFHIYEGHKFKNDQRLGDLNS